MSMFDGGAKQRSFMPQGSGEVDPPPYSEQTVPEAEVIPIVFTKDQRERVEQNTALARYLASRFYGEDTDAILGSAMLGLAGAAFRFSPDRGVEFSTYATHIIVGEIKRHFRDNSWPMHIERSFQEKMLKTRNAATELTQNLGRHPTSEEIGNKTGMTPEEVEECLASYSILRNIGSLDSPLGEGEESDILADTIVDPDHALEFDAVENRHLLRETLTQLPERERRILALYFWEGLSQQETADTMGISQMHVSRRLSWAIARLRTILNNDE